MFQQLNVSGVSGHLENAQYLVAMVQELKTAKNWLKNKMVEIVSGQLMKLNHAVLKIVQVNSKTRSIRYFRLL